MIPTENAFTMPQNAAIRMATATASTHETPLFIIRAATQTESASTPPTEMSMPPLPVIITIVIPMAVMPCREMFCRIFMMFLVFRKYGDTKGITIKNTAMMPRRTASSEKYFRIFFNSFCIVLTSLSRSGPLNHFLSFLPH